MAVLAAAAAAASLAPLFRERAAADTARSAQEIYRHQLGELDRDAARGLIGPAEAEAARAEIARRLLRAADGESDAATGGDRRSRTAAAAAIVAAPLAALALYAFLGAPGLPDRPLAARMAAPPEQADFAALMARVEDHLAANPDDGHGWEVVAPIYVRMGRFDDAAAAYANVLRLQGSSATREADYGEATVLANRGRITGEARAAFERAVAFDPGHARSRFYLARALEQEGDDDGARAALQALLADAPPERPWGEAAREVLAAIDRRLGLAPPETAATPQPGPTADDVAAAAEMAPEDRRDMIEGMVASLAARLADEPGDAEGWARLIRSYVVLDRSKAAAGALNDARAALTGDADGLATVEAAAAELGLETPGSRVQ